MGIDPGTLMIASTVIGGVMSAVGTVAGVQASNAQAKYQAQVARNNQIIANQNARRVEETGALTEQDEIRRVRAALGEQEVAQAASGLDIATGTPADVRKGTSLLGASSIRNVRDAVARDAYGFRVAGVDYGNMAAVQTAQSKQGWALPLAGSLLGSAADVGKQFIGMKATGVPMNGLELMFS